ncbi:hypothetical protein BTR14_19665 [Rhizobium rhizosphaerae]|uniref:Uncharacterized protein n=1 Tax=Xaviernesmea rhizosphaerae TaxID=1672749 RepID=A0ABX3P9L0_9HYPH|nr:hypothetical protein [Xaviernesmea rhizosphaerae]OQP84386.1 hypothetical protein BTR14_19665 [Xaviernesmea rhizosphaerae]
MMDMFLISKIIDTETQTLRERSLRGPSEMEIIAARIAQARRRARLSRRLMLWLRQLLRRRRRQRMAADQLAASASGRRLHRAGCIAQQVATIRPPGACGSGRPCHPH